MFAAAWEARGSVGDLRLVYHCMPAALSRLEEAAFSRPARSGPAECCNWECGGGRDPTRGNSLSPHCIPAVMSHLPQHLIQTGHLCFPQRSLLSRPLRKLSECFWHSDGPSFLPLAAPSFCFGLRCAHALHSIKGLITGQKSLRLMELIYCKYKFVIIYFKFKCIRQYSYLRILIWYFKKCPIQALLTHVVHYYCK